MSSRVSQKQAKRQANMVVRQQLAKEQRRRKMMVGVGAAALILVAGLIGWGVYSGQQPTSFATPAHATSNADGLIATTGPVSVEIYQDYMCPHCKEFEQSAATTIDQLVKAGKIQLVIHPVAILDGASSTRYSTRAAASAGCASDGNKLLAYNTALFAQQPEEGGAGLSNDKLVQIGGTVGLTDASFGSCVTGGKYLTWVPHVTDEASRRGLQGTPTVYVGGKKLDEPSAASLTAALAAAS